MPTLLEIEIGLHYACTGESDFRNGDLEAPAVQAALRNFVDLGLLNEHEVCAQRYVATEGLRAWMEALKRVPFPEQQWVVPSSFAGIGASVGGIIGAGSLERGADALRQQIIAQRLSDQQNANAMADDSPARETACGNRVDGTVRE